MFDRGDIGLIIGKKGSGKTLLAKKLCKDISINYIYLDYNSLDKDYLENFYNENKNKKSIIIFDNYVCFKKNKKIDRLIRNNENFTILYVMNYIDLKILMFTDTIYIAKDNDYDVIKHYHQRLKKYFKNCSIDWLTNAMEDLKDYGFLSFDKDNNDKKKELYLKF